VKTLGAKPRLVVIVETFRLRLDPQIAGTADEAVLSHLKETKVTADACEKLQKALPDCKIEWRSGDEGGIWRPP